MSEAIVLARVRLALQNIYCTLFRNNVGVARTDDGRYIKYGLANGSSDLIGFYELVIKPEHVGRKVAIFTAIECKNGRAGKRSTEQMDFIARIELAGGIAGFAHSEQDALNIVERWLNKKGGI